MGPDVTERKIITVPFVSGVDLGDGDPQLTDKSLRLENAIINRQGAVDKRFGKTGIAGTFTEKCLGVYKDKLIAIGDTVSMMDSAGTFDTIDTDVGLCDISSSLIMATEQGVVCSPECVVYGDMLYMAREGIGGPFFDAFSRSTGAKMQDTHALGGTGVLNARLIYIAAQARIYALYRNTSGQICVIPVSADGSRATARNLTISDSWPAMMGTLDAVAVSDTKIMLAYKQYQSAVTESNTVSATSGTKTITAAGAIFLATDVGRKITLSGSTATPSNDGTYTIASRVDANNVTVTEAVPSDEAAGALDLSMEMSDLVIGVITVSGDTVTGTAGTVELVRPGLDSSAASISVCKFTAGEAYIVYYQNETGSQRLRGVSYTSALAVGETDAQLVAFPTAITGTDVALTFAGTTVTLVDTAAPFSPRHIGLTITVSGATNAGNNGAFTIATFVDSTTVTFTNASGVTESGAADYSLRPLAYLFQASAVTITDNSLVYVYYTLSEDITGRHALLYRVADSAATGAGSAYVVSGDVSLWGKPVLDSVGHVYLPLHHSFEGRASAVLDGHIQRGYFLLRDDFQDGITWPYPVGRYFPLDACEQAGQGYKDGAPQALVADGTNKWLLIGQQLTGGTNTATGSVERTDLHLVSLDLTPTWRKDLEAHHELIIPNSVPYAMGCGKVYELGPLTYPERVTGHASGALSSFNVGAGTWEYRVTYEVYAGGVRYESAPSPAVQVATIATNDQVTLTIPTLKITRFSEDAQVRIVVYRSKADGSTSLLLIGTMDNNPDVATVDYVDGGAANVGAAQEYTANGSVLQNEPPFPFGEASAIWQQRLFFSDPAYPDRLVRYSKEFSEGNGPAFSWDMYVVCSPEGGNIKALEPMGDRLVIFKRNAIYATNGAGLDNTGAGVGYAAPQLISPGIGCIDARSVIRTPRGILFQSDDCIYLLDPGLSLQPVGRPVKFHTDSLVIASACLVSEYNMVLFITDDLALVYNYLFDAWTTWENFDGQDCAVANGILYYKGEAGDLWKYDTATYLDDAVTMVGLAAETPWIQPGGINALNRVWELRLLGYSSAARTVQVKIAYDHDPSWVDTLTLNTTDLGDFGPTQHYGTMAAGNEDQALLLRFRGSRTKCSAIRLRIEDIAA
jgi:hypothetical protein